MFRLPWTMSQVGMEQLVGLLSADEEKGLSDRASEAFEAWTRATADELDHLVAAAIKAGDGKPGELSAQILEFLTPADSTPGRAVKKGFDLAQQAVESLQAAASEHDRPAWVEFSNKLESFATFRYVDDVLGLDPAADLSLHELVNQAQALEPYRAVWATEGLGYYWTERTWDQGEPPSQLFAGETADKGMLALHAGMGLSMARRCLQDLDAGCAATEVQQQLHRFVALCRDNSQEGYTEVGLEALGLIARSLHPDLVKPIDQQLSSIYPEILPYFWHGVGRGSYFLPFNLVPRLSSASRALEVLRREAPNEEAWNNALSGLAWPIILVNIRHPQIIEAFVAQHGDQLAATDAFANGAGSSIATWFDSTGGDPHLVRFCQHRSDSADDQRTRLWESQVREPCRQALKNYYPDLKQNHLLGHLFRYYPLDPPGMSKFGDPVLSTVPHATL